MSHETTLLHEALHCQFMQWSLEAINDPIREHQLADLYGYAFYDTSSTSPNLLLIVNGGNASQHEEMVNNYINLIAQSVFQYATAKGYGNVTFNYCKDLAWAGLEKTIAFSKLSGPDQQRIIAVIHRELSPGVILESPDGLNVINGNQENSKGHKCN
jgi:hypothetical protein